MVRSARCTGAGMQVTVLGTWARKTAAADRFGGWQAELRPDQVNAAKRDATGPVWRRNEFAWVQLSGNVDGRW